MDSDMYYITNAHTFATESDGSASYGGFSGKVMAWKLINLTRADQDIEGASVEHLPTLQSKKTTILRMVPLRCKIFTRSNEEVRECSRSDGRWRREWRKQCILLKSHQSKLHRRVFCFCEKIVFSSNACAHERAPNPIDTLHTHSKNPNLLSWAPKAWAKKLKPFLRCQKSKKWPEIAPFFNRKPMIPSDRIQWWHSVNHLLSRVV